MSLYEAMQPVGDSLVPERGVVAVIVEDRLVRLAVKLPQERKKIEHRDVEVIGDLLQPPLGMIVNEVGLDLHPNREGNDQQLEAVLLGLAPQFLEHRFETDPSLPTPGAPPVWDALLDDPIESRFALERIAFARGKFSTDLPEPGRPLLEAPLLLPGQIVG